MSGLVLIVLLLCIVSAWISIYVFHYYFFVVWSNVIQQQVPPPYDVRWASSPPVHGALLTVLNKPKQISVSFLFAMCTEWFFVFLCQRHFTDDRWDMWCINKSSTFVPFILPELLFWRWFVFKFYACFWYVI